MAEADSSDDSEDEMEAREGFAAASDISGGEAMTGSGAGIGGGGARSRSKSGSAGFDADISGDAASSLLPSRHDLMFGLDWKARGGGGGGGGGAGGGGAGFFKSTKKSYPMYPLREEKIKWDDYGEVIKEEDFKFAENPNSVVPGFGDDAVAAKDNADNAGVSFLYRLTRERDTIPHPFELFISNSLCLPELPLKKARKWLSTSTFQPF